MKKQIKICIISSQILGPEKVGGFGSMTRQLARCLVRDGYSVDVVIPGRRGIISGQHTDGFFIVALSKIAMFKFSTFRAINADIYHSQDTTAMSLIAEIAEPTKKHIITCRDPRTIADWIIELRYSTWSRRLKILFNYFFESGPFVYFAVRRADAIGVPALFLRDKVKRMYHLKKTPEFLPNIEDVPHTLPKKATQPTVCFVGRLDGRKRPELFIELAGKFPHVAFLMVGKAEEKTRQEKLKKMAASHKNLTMLGYLDKFESNDFYYVYDQSWIMVNTASREALPLTIIEATGRGCAILSYVNPDNFASHFGFWAKSDNFAEGLAYLLENNRWRERGEQAHAYVLETYGKEKATEAHFALYNKILSNEK